MNCGNKCGFSACCCIGLLISVVFGAVVGVLFAFEYICFIRIAAWIAFGFGVLTLVLLIFGLFSASVNPPSALSRCLCKYTSCLLVGIIGTIITALAALVIVLNPACISVITLVAIGAFFFALMIIALIALIRCIICKMCFCCRECVEEC